MTRLSIVVPVYNEAPTIDAILERLRDMSFNDAEVIIVDDGSTDGTAERLLAWKSVPGFELHFHPLNRGKGSAVRSGLAIAQGKVAIIQDADLEYDPSEIPKLVEPILDGREQVVFGSRYLESKQPWSVFRLAVVMLNVMSRVLYRQRLTDQATCYKAMPLELWRRLNLDSERFELCAEITAKLGRMKIPIREIPIRYEPRSRADGKKIRFRDGISAFWKLIAIRFRRFENL
jgi:dolichol-phosphate mannosyltransferase